MMRRIIVLFAALMLVCSTFVCFAEESLTIDSLTSGNAASIYIRCTWKRSYHDFRIDSRILEICD